jgi:hypothetical protein
MITKPVQYKLLEDILHLIAASGQPVSAVEVKIRTYNSDKKRISIVVGKAMPPISSLVISESVLHIEPQLPQYASDEQPLSDPSHSLPVEVVPESTPEEG